MSAVWLTCARHDRYEVSSLGQVRNRKTGRVLIPAQNSKQGRPGYLKLWLNRRNEYVHRLVAETFFGPPPPGWHTDHIDHDRWNNAVSNLRYVPKPENDFRWKDRTADGRNVWESPYLDGEAAPEDHVPMTEEEHVDLHQELAGSGW